MLIKNKDLIQSYILTTAYYSFSVYEKRVVYRVIEVLQSKLKGLSLNYSYSMNEDLMGNTTFTMPISCFLRDENDKNYDRVKEALVDLRNKGFEYQDSKEWGYYGIIEMPKTKRFDTDVQFTVQPLLMNAFLNFSKGFRKYDLKTAFQLESTYAMRFYELFTGKQKQQINYSIEELKKMFCLSDKYKLTADFMRYVIEPAKRELDKVSPISFHHETRKTGRKITHINFKVYEIPKNKDTELERKQLQQKESLRWSLDSNQIRYLKDYFDFTEKGIKNNIDVIKQFANLEDAEDQLRNINKMVLEYDIRNKAGFFIKQAQKLIENN